MNTKQKKLKASSTEAAVASKPKTQTLGEFRAWLSGVEEMQPENWAPDLTQWRRIRERIENVIEGRSFKSGAAGASDDGEEPAPRVYRAAGPSGFAPGQLMPQPVAATPPPFMNTSGVEGARIKTPNVDTSGGQYASSLE